MKSVIRLKELICIRSLLKERELAWQPPGGPYGGVAVTTSYRAKKALSKRRFDSVGI